MSNCSQNYENRIDASMDTIYLFNGAGQLKILAEGSLLVRTTMFTTILGDAIFCGSTIP